MKIGDKVIVLKSSHADIQPGAKGEVESEFCDGIGVKIKGQFGIKLREETRVIFFNIADLKLDTTQ